MGSFGNFSKRGYSFAEALEDRLRSAEQEPALAYPANRLE